MSPQVVRALNSVASTGADCHGKPDASPLALMRGASQVSGETVDTIRRERAPSEALSLYSRALRR